MQTVKHGKPQRFNEPPKYLASVKIASNTLYHVVYRLSDCGNHVSDIITIIHIGLNLLRQGTCIVIAGIRIRLNRRFHLRQLSLIQITSRVFTNTG